MSVYVDDAFCHGSWGKWQGGGHLMSDTPEELHAFAKAIGLKREWFQERPRWFMCHYDLTRTKREAAIAAGAIAETVEDGSFRRRVLRERTRSEKGL